MDIKENVKYILKKRNMTQDDLARKMEVSRQTINYYLKGNITIDTLKKMALALDTTIETIISDTPLVWKEETIPTHSSATKTKLVCPHCGEEITIIAK